MKGFSLLAAIMLTFLVCCAAAPPPPPAYEASIYPLMNAEREPFCSAFVINSEKRFLMTAEHCVQAMQQPFLPNDGMAWEVFHVQEIDIAVIHARSVYRIPALIPELELPAIDDAITMYGFPNGRKIRSIKGKVLFPFFQVGGNTLPLMLVAPGPQPGMSGGPYLNKDGKVIGVNLRRRDDPDLGMTVPMPVIYTLTQEYWSYQPPVKE